MNSPLVIAAQVFGTIQNTLAANAVGGSTETAFSVNGNSIAGIAAKVSPLSIGNPGIFVAGSYALSTLASTGLPFRVRAWGHVKSGSTQNLTIALYCIPAASYSTLTATVFTGATAIASTGAVAVNSTSGVWYLDTVLSAVAISTTAVTLQGIQNYSYVAAVGVAAGAITNKSSLLGEQDLNFFLTSVLSTGSNAGDLVTCDGFNIELVG